MNNAKTEAKDSSGAHEAKRPRGQEAKRQSKSTCGVEKKKCRRESGGGQVGGGNIGESEETTPRIGSALTRRLTRVRQRQCDTVSAQCEKRRAKKKENVSVKRKRETGSAAGLHSLVLRPLPTSASVAYRTAQPHATLCRDPQRTAASGGLSIADECASPGPQSGCPDRLQWTRSWSLGCGPRSARTRRRAPALQPSATASPQVRHLPLQAGRERGGTTRQQQRAADHGDAVMFDCLSNEKKGGRARRVGVNARGHAHGTAANAAAGKREKLRARRGRDGLVVDATAFSPPWWRTVLRAAATRFNPGPSPARGGQVRLQPRLRPGGRQQGLLRKGNVAGVCC